MTGKPRKTKVRGEDYWYVDAKDPVTGKRVRKFFRTKAEADAEQERVNRAASKVREPLHPQCDPEVIVRDYGAVYLARHRPEWRPGTHRLFSDLLRVHVYPFPIGPGPRVLGDLRVRDWTRGIVPAIAEAMRCGEHPYAIATTRLVLVAVSGLLTDAVGDELLPSHPIDTTIRKQRLRPLLKETSDQAKVKAFTADEARHFLAVAKEHSSLFPLYLTGFLGGLRLGELTALRLEDDRFLAVDGRRVRQLRVERSFSKDDCMRNPQPGPTKTGKPREVNVAAELGGLFDAIKAERPRLALRHGWRPVPPWLFVTGNGTPYGHSNARTDFRRVLDLAGLGHRELTPHSMRHTFASLHILNGKPAKWIQQQMGHSSIRVTLDTYADWFKLQDHAAADQLAGALLGNAAGNQG